MPMNAQRALTSVIILTIVVLNAPQAAWAQTVPLTLSSSVAASTALPTDSAVPTPAVHRTNAWLYVGAAAAVVLLAVAINAHCHQYPLACAGGGDGCSTDSSDTSNIAHNIGVADRKRAPALGLNLHYSLSWTDKGA